MEWLIALTSIGLVVYAFGVPSAHTRRTEDHAAAGAAGEARRATTYRYFRRRDLAWGVALGIAGLTFLFGITERDSQKEADQAALEREKNPPVGVTFYDLTGTKTPEYATIGDEVVPLRPPADDAWWVPFVPFLGTVFAAVILGAVTMYTDRRGTGIEERLSALEKAQNGSPP